MIEVERCDRETFPTRQAIRNQVKGIGSGGKVDPQIVPEFEPGQVREGHGKIALSCLRPLFGRRPAGIPRPVDLPEALFA